MSQSEMRNNYHVSEESKDSNSDSVVSDGSDDSEMESFEDYLDFVKEPQSLLDRSEPDVKALLVNHING